MIVCRRPLVLVTDLVGVSLTLAVVAATTFLVVLPYCRQQWRLPALRSRAAAVQRQNVVRAAQNAASLTAIRQLEHGLDQRTESATNDVGRVLDEMARCCSAIGLTLEQFQPMPPVSSGRFNSWDVRVTARGRFADFQRLLRWVEGRSEYTYVRELDVLKVSSPDAANRPTAECRLQWTVRVNYMPDRPPAGEGES